MEGLKNRKQLKQIINKIKLNHYEIYSIKFSIAVVAPDHR